VPKSASIQIRAATADDAGVLAETISLAYRDVARRFGITLQNAPTHPSNAQSHWVLSDVAQGTTYLMAMVDKSCVGCVAYRQSGTELEAQRLAVVPAHRGGQVAQLLNEAILRAAKSAGAKKIRISIVADHHSLRRWYQRMGFRAVETRVFDDLPFEVQYLELQVAERGR
jgi:N-acetylglutamate synthase-like GNAT family acetyltransferase